MRASGWSKAREKMREARLGDLDGGDGECKREVSSSGSGGGGGSGSGSGASSSKPQRAQAKKKTFKEHQAVLLEGQGWRLRDNTPTLDVDDSCTVLSFSHIADLINQRDVWGLLTSRLIASARAGELAHIKELVVDGAGIGPWGMEDLPNCKLADLLEALVAGACPELRGLSLCDTYMDDDDATIFSDASPR